MLYSGRMLPPLGPDLFVRAWHGEVPLHTPKAFEAMRAVGAHAAKCLELVSELVKPGVATQALDAFVFEYATAHQLYPAPLNYRGFPKSCCTSVNHVVCHGIPGPKPLHEGDILNIDVTFIKDGWHGDSSRMVLVGEVSDEARALCAATREAMMRGIAVVREGATLGDIGWAIQSFAEERGYSVVRDFCGHGLGRIFHSSPEVLHYGRPGKGTVLKEGMFFTIEPMINLGKPEVRVLSDGWTALTKDRSLSAQWEHSIGVTKDGCEIFTV